MKEKKKLLSLLMVMIMLVSLLGAMPVQAAPKVKNQTKSVKLVVKQKYAIKPPVKMTFKSNKPKVVSVNSKGVMTAKATGSAVITGKYKKVTWKYKVTVKKAPTVSKSVWITSTGKKYHSRSTCSNMKKPQKISLSKAKSLGYSACKKCF